MVQPSSVVVGGLVLRACSGCTHRVALFLSRALPITKGEGWEASSRDVSLGALLPFWEFEEMGGGEEANDYRPPWGEVKEPDWP